ncbi:MAG: MarR family transcriptional regulator [Bacteroidales bacterium]|nr:MarR family transcriptional regulator [Bacteroidales bacterium]
MPLKLTYPQYLVLMVLWEKDNQLVSDISHQMMLESNTLTPLLQRMEREGLVVRTKGIADGRQTLVSLTKKGQRLQERCKDIPECMAAHIGNGNISPEQATNLKGTLDALIKTLR